MKSLEDILVWAENFDTDKYSTNVYQELVLDSKIHPTRFEIMGAWKTGCLRQNKDGKEYSDDFGKSYSYTLRWSDHTPVGKNTWVYINDNTTEILPQIPSKCPTNEPAILSTLKGSNGFGFIWGLFTLHCCYPVEYPLYDQHVYRAFKNIEPDGKPLPLKASYHWKDFIAYKAFFDQMLTRHAIDHWILDRALWSYGKWLKQGINIAKNKEKIKFEPVAKTNFLEFIKFDNMEQEYTLGGKKKPFSSKIDENINLIIQRRFKGTKPDNISKYSFEELEAIQLFMKNQNWVPLANSVSNMQNGSEILGLGSFVFNNIRANQVFAQSTSQLAAIFVVAGIWDLDKMQINGKGKRRMVFKYKDINWKEALIAYYAEQDAE
ncbi:hypothetical protein [Dyadobacter sp. 3J3]|uniref:hypothetical protein n=1 Tax=Dyadobacter sp. 3J3 TaxID=2606600 RepID=UPI0013568590|nr:hypothetical protein [Dyadobacter sp. 3J3]